MRIVVGITGASGVIYRKRLLEVAKEKGIEVHLVVSDAAKRVAEYELPGFDFSSLAYSTYQNSDLAAPIASGSFRVDAMVIVPASMKTVGSLASGICEDLICRAADVQLKERRKLVIVPRETSIHAVHLENMATLSKLGAVILPAMPAFYHKPTSVSDIIDFIVGRVFDQLGVEHNLFKRWGS